MKIIQKAKSENRIKTTLGLYEKHHILPKVLFPLWSNKKFNLVLLTLREHYFCHLLLKKIYPSSKMTSACFLIAVRFLAYSSREYERIKNEWANELSQIQKGKTGFFTGKFHSEESRKKISQNTKFGMSQMTETEKEKLKTALGKTPYNKGKTNKELFGEKKANEIKEKLSILHKGKPSNRKGVKLSEETRKKIGDGARGKVHSQESKEKMRLSSLGKISYQRGVTCIETGEVFQSIKEASEKYKISHLGDKIKKQQKYKGLTFIFTSY